MVDLQIYQPLDTGAREFRLLLVHPGSADDQVQCQFKIVSLSELPFPPYETISYVWGDSTKRGHVYIDTQELDVPASAANVLKRFRHAEHDRVVWIDAICINQQDINERSHQVQLMCEIYSRTTLGLVWLGDNDERAGEIFAALRSLHCEAARETDDFRTFKATVWPGWWDTYRRPSSVQFDPDAMAKFFDEPWFARLWIVQEAALPPRSECFLGCHRMPLRELLRSAVWLWSSSTSTRSSLSGHSGLARAVHIASYSDELFESPFRSATNLQWMLHTLRQYYTCRPEDHIYGLVGMYQRFKLGDQPLPAKLWPDYNRTLRAIFNDAAKLCVSERQSLDALIYVSHRCANELDPNDFPTWIPKWHRKQDLALDALPLNFAGFQSCRQAKHRSMDLETRDEGVLSVEGFTVDHVRFRSEKVTEDVLEDCNTLLGILRSAEALLDGLECKRGQLPPTLVASLHHRRSSMDREESKEGYRALMQYLSTKTGEGAASDRMTLDCAIGVGNAYYRALVRWLRNRCFFVTTKGYLGIGPEVLQSDDLVVVLRGAAVPLILRQHRDAAASHVLVGHAYVDCLMSGEALELQSAERLEDKVFCLV